LVTEDLKQILVLILVDRITPATTDADRDYVRSHCGVADGWPVVAESYIQWVIEESFCNGRPPLELLSSSPYNILITEHVEAYECMKMRLLNASHTGMCYIGYLMGYNYIHEIMLDKQIEVYINQLMNIEVTPTLSPVPGIDIEKYKCTLIERFSNPNIKDTALRVCMDGASKFPKFLVPTIVEQLKRGNNPHYCALAVGAWIRYLGGVDEKNKPIKLQDALADELKLSELAIKIKPSAKEILSVNQVFGVLAENQQFSQAVERVVKLFYEVGSKETLKQWVNEDPYKN
jgi:mannitol 2-dehydrogenase